MTTSTKIKPPSTTRRNARRRTRRKFEATLKESGLLRLFELAPELKSIRESIIKSLFYLFMNGMFYGQEIANAVLDDIEQQSHRRPDISSLLTEDGAAADPF